MVRSSAPGLGRRSGPGPRHPPRGSRNVRMVTRGLGPPRSSPDGRAPSPPPRRSGRTRVPRPFGPQSWGAPLRAPTPGRLPRLLTHRPRARGSQGRPLPPCGRSPRGPGPHTPLQTGRRLRAGRALEPGRLGLGQGSRARRETPGASHEAFPAERLPDAGSVGSPAPAPGLELAASASEPWNRAESGEALPFQLQPESRPPRRGGVTGARGGVLGGWGVRTGEKGWGAGLLRRLPGRSGDTNAGHRSRCPGCGAATTPPENTIQSFPALWPRNPSLCPSGSQTLLNLTLPCGLRCWRPKNASSPTPCSRAPVRSLSSLSVSSSWIHPQRPASESSFGGKDPT